MEERATQAMSREEPWSAAGRESGMEEFWRKVNKVNELREFCVRRRERTLGGRKFAVFLGSDLG